MDNGLHVQMAVKQVVESSISSARRAWSAQFGARHGKGEAAPVLQKIAKGLSSSSDSTATAVERQRIVLTQKTPRIASVRLSHCSRPSVPGLTQRKPMPAAGCLLAALKPHRNSPKSRRGVKSQQRKNNRSQSWMRPIQPLNSSPWVSPDMEVLSLAIPVQIL